MDNFNPPSLRLPKPNTFFQHRAERFHQLAQTHVSMAGYLGLMAELAEIQSTLPQYFPLSPVPVIDGAHPPLDTARWLVQPVWREGLRLIAGRIEPATEPLALILARLNKASDAEMEGWAAALLAGEWENLDAGLAPFLAAALQAYWASLAAGLETGEVERRQLGGFDPQPAYLCPVCGCLPVASVLQTGGGVQGLRYLCCGLCASQWNRPRIQCVHCGGSQSVAYFSIEGAGEAVKAEACGECKTYIKLMDREKDARLDPVADDLASLGLDILLAEAGYQRLGFNPLLISS